MSYKMHLVLLCTDTTVHSSRTHCRGKSVPGHPSPQEFDTPHTTKLGGDTNAAPTNKTPQDLPAGSLFPNMQIPALSPEHTTISIKNIITIIMIKLIMLIITTTTIKEGNNTEQHI